MVPIIPGGLRLQFGYLPLNLTLNSEKNLFDPSKKGILREKRQPRKQILRLKTFLIISVSFNTPYSNQNVIASFKSWG